MTLTNSLELIKSFCLEFDEEVNKPLSCIKCRRNRKLNISHHYTSLLCRIYFHVHLPYVD